jgi:hypothetical protein
LKDGGRREAITELGAVVAQRNGGGEKLKSRRLSDCTELEEHKDASVHPLGGLVEEERWQSSPSPVSSWSGKNGGGKLLTGDRKGRREGVDRFLWRRRPGGARGHLA